MPKQRSNHVQKNRPEQRDYRKGIKSESDTPTGESASLFSPTAQPDDENDFPSTGKRPSAWKQAVANYLKDNWVPCACSVLILVLGWFTIDARMKFSNHDTTFESHSKTLDSHEDFIDKQRDVNATQNIAISETRTLLGTIQTALTEIKADIRELRKPNGKK